MFNMVFKPNELPYNQFARIGLDKEHLFWLPVRELDALLCGRRTGFFHINSFVADGYFQFPEFDVKLSLVRNNDRSVSLRLHPINHEAFNTFMLTPDEVNNLKRTPGKIIQKQDVRATGGNGNLLVQYDPDTREFVGKPVSDIIAPLEVDDLKLSGAQREDWRHGKEIEVYGGKVCIDLVSSAGFRGRASKFVIKQGIAYHVPGTNF